MNIADSLKPKVYARLNDLSLAQAMILQVKVRIFNSHELPLQASCRRRPLRDANIKGLIEVKHQLYQYEIIR